MKNKWLALKQEREKTVVEQSTIDKWSAYPGVSDFVDESIKNALMEVLENQSLMNGITLQNERDAYSSGIVNNSFDILVETYKQVRAFDAVSVGAMNGPTTFVKFWQGKEIKKEEIAAKTRKLRSSFYMPEDLKQADRPKHELIKDWALDFASEWDREVFTDLRNNVGFVETIDVNDASRQVRRTKIKEGIKNMSSKIGEHVSSLYEEKNANQRDANWMVMCPEVYDELFDIKLDCLDHRYIHKMFNENKKIFVDPLFPSQQILMGYKGNNLEAGYFFRSYVELTATPTILDPETFCPRRGALRRYAKKLLRSGAKFYGRIDLSV